MRKLREREQEWGVTLVEMMVVLAILGIVMTGMYNTFIFQQKNYSVQDNVVVMQQNVRVGLDYMVKGIRMAGYIPEDIPFDPSNPPVPTPQDPAPTTDVSSESFTDGVSESIEEATASAITFQADIDDDAITETVRYVLNGTNLTREVWEWNAVGTSWNASGGALIVAENIESMVFTYTLLADDQGLDDNINNDGDSDTDEQGELMTWDFGANGALNTNTLRGHIRQVFVTVTARSDNPDPDYTHPTQGDHYRRRVLSTNISLRNM